MFLSKNVIKNAKLLHKLQRTCTRSVRSASKTKILRELPSEKVEEIIERCQEKIIYSSYLEGLEHKLGFKKSKIFEEKIRHKENRQLYEQSELKPFPLALRYLDENKFNVVTEKEDDLQEESTVETEKRYYIPFSHARNIFHPKHEATAENNAKTTQWMSDYEYFEENDDDTFANHSQYGTPDPSIPVSNVPCSGCGAHLHCTDASLPGYIPTEIFKNRSAKELTTIICQRCHFLKNYNTAINVTVTPEDYVNVISSIKSKKALAILLVDLLDIENSIWPGIMQILGEQRPIVVVGNKVDLLPRDFPGHLDHVQKCVQKAIIEAGFNAENILHVGLISATTGFGVEELITKLHNVWGRRVKEDVYIVGCTNVGKSSLFNTLLRSDFCKAEASNIINRATASPWPGTTIKLLKFPILRPSDHRLFLRTKRLKKDKIVKAQEDELRRLQANKTRKIEYATLIGHIGRTFVPSNPASTDPFSLRSGHAAGNVILTIDENDEKYKYGTWCYDTPGVVQPQQILNLLTTEELLKVIPKQMITPKTFVFRKGMSIFLAGLARVDMLDGLNWIRVQLYASDDLPTLMTKTEDADEMYETLFGSKILGVPFGSEERLEKFPKLKASEEITIEGVDKTVNCADILLSSSGWLGVSLPPNHKVSFRVWTPDARGIVARVPALIPYGIQLRGKRIRGSYAYHKSKPFISFRK